LLKRCVSAIVTWRNLPRVHNVPLEPERAIALTGEYFRSYGVRQNTREIEAITSYTHGRRLTACELMAEDSFVASTFDLAKV
jgi:hypothetical protein